MELHLDTKLHDQENDVVMTHVNQQLDRAIIKNNILTRLWS